jgi:hypothetical protein
VIFAVDTWGMRIGLARMVVYGMAAFAVFVQLGVWGATKIRADGRSFDLDGGVTLVAGLGAYRLAAGLGERAPGAGHGREGR